MLQKCLVYNKYSINVNCRDRCRASHVMGKLTKLKTNKGVSTLPRVALSGLTPERCPSQLRPGLQGLLSLSLPTSLRSTCHTSGLRRVVILLYRLKYFVALYLLGQGWLPLLMSIKALWTIPGERDPSLLCGSSSLPVFKGLSPISVFMSPPDQCQVSVWN